MSACSTCTKKFRNSIESSGHKCLFTYAACENPPQIPILIPIRIQKSTREYVCNCGKTYKSKNYLIQHYKRACMSNPNINQYECKTCNIKFHASTTYYRHRKMHINFQMNS
jgi:hypothetical protein